MPLIEVTHLSVLREKQLILDNISFAIQAGDYIGLIGPNGAGKTTLLKTLLGLIKPTTGKIKKKKNLTIGYVPQHYTLSPIVPISVQEVLSMSGSSETSFLKDVLTKVQLTPSLLPQNFHTLSGGQKQRVIIARALCLQPDILMFDEPLSGVDFKTKRQLYELLSLLNQSERLTILFVSHEVDHIISKCHHILCLNKKLHTGCHPLDFAKGHTHCCPSTPNPAPLLTPIHHHHAANES